MVKFIDKIIEGEPETILEMNIEGTTLENKDIEIKLEVEIITEIIIEIVLGMTICEVETLVETVVE